jgi:hypothetical protein
MAHKSRKKYFHEGKYVAEVDVSLIEDDTELAPYLSVDDAYKLDDVREALRNGDLKDAGRYGTVYEMRPVTSP